jgi:hypothetical protein
MNLDQLLSAFAHPVGPLRILIVDDQPTKLGRSGVQQWSMGTSPIAAERPP